MLQYFLNVFGPSIFIIFVSNLYKCIHNIFEIIVNVYVKLSTLTYHLNHQN